MTANLDHAVRSALVDIMATSPTPEALPTAIVAACDERSFRRRSVAIAASVVILAGVGALVALTDFRSSNGTAASDSVASESASAPAVDDAGADPVPPAVAADTSQVPGNAASVDPTSPVSVTGQRIGEVPADEAPTWTGNGEIDPKELPAWATVASAGRVIGYVKPFDVLLGDSDQVTIYDEGGQPIGAFVGGKPVIEGNGFGE